MRRRALLAAVTVATAVLATAGVRFVADAGTTPPSTNATFVHPGVLVSRTQLDFVKSKVAAKAQPWLNAYNQMIGSRYASLSRTPKPRATVECGPYSNPNNGCTDEREDAIAAYTDALVWYTTGNAAYAQKSIALMDAWSATIKTHTNSNAPLQTGADHGSGVGWTSNTASNGLIVNGDNVTFYGLFVEHYQQYQTIWNGNGGRTYFYQNEMPYDPPNQAAYMNGGTQGWAAYKVADSVTTHEAWGLGSYCFFNANPSVVNARAFEVPVKPGVRFHNMVTVSLGGTGTISHVINNTGAAVNTSHQVTDLVSGP